MSSDNLIIYLKNDDLPECGILQANGAFEKTSQTLSELSQRAFAEVIVIAPPSAVLLAETILPKMPKQRLLQALPFALEESLLADIQDLHFAIAPLKRLSKETTEVVIQTAIVAKAALRQWLDGLHAQGIYPTCIVPAPLMIPREEQYWSVVIEDAHSTLLRDADLHGSTFDTTNLNEYLSFKLHEAKTLPKAIHLYRFAETPASLNLDIPLIEKSVGTQSLIEFFAKQVTTPTINLLQSEFQAKRKRGEQKTLWKIIPALAAAWLALILISNSVSYLALHHKEALLQADITKIYKKNFPNATAIVAPKQRMQDKLNSLVNGGQKNHFLSWLSTLGHTLAGNSNFKIKQMDYRDNLLNLQFTADNFATVENLVKGLTKQNLNAKQENVAQDGTTVKGILVISEGNAA